MACAFAYLENQKGRRKTMKFSELSKILQSHQWVFIEEIYGVRNYRIVFDGEFWAIGRLNYDRIKDLPVRNIYSRESKGKSYIMIMLDASNKEI